MEDEPVRQRPQHADEAGKQYARLDQADRQAGRQIRKVACVFVHALVGIDADGAGIGQTEGAGGPHPFVDEVERQAFSKLQPDQLAEPGLRHVENEQRSGNLGKDDELVQEGR
ncbi:hypothetical protein D3C72_2026110 [compost metagenome]